MPICILQRILWREKPNDELREYRLTTVTYGITSAPYLALRTLLQLASDEEHRFLQGALIVRQNMYVDDILAGGNTLRDALEKTQIERLFQASGFQLNKWAASHEALRPVNESVSTTQKLFTETVNSKGVTSLDIFWNLEMDDFALRASTDEASSGVPTKRF